jgi:hypothetical protein
VAHGLQYSGVEIVRLQVHIYKEVSMSLAAIFNILPGSPLTSGIIALAAAVVLLYLARGPAHKAIYSLSRVVHAGFRLMARSVTSAPCRGRRSGGAAD